MNESHQLQDPLSPTTLPKKELKLKKPKDLNPLLPNTTIRDKFRCVSNWKLKYKNTLYLGSFQSYYQKGKTSSSFRPASMSCKICHESVSESNKGINCDACQSWYHTKCIQMKDASYKMFKRENLQWVCQECISAQREENGLNEVMLELIRNFEKEKERIGKRESYEFGTYEKLRKRKGKV